MSVFDIFLIIYIIVFIVYGSKYSSNMQELNNDIKLLKIEGINIEKVKDRIECRTKKSLKMRKIIWICEPSIFVIHVLVILILDFRNMNDLLNAFLLFGSSLIFILIIHWLKGAGTLPNKPIFRDHFWD